MKPKITIITVVKNAEKTIQKCMKSVLSQTYSNIEYIIQDGKSSDQTIAKVQEISDPRVIFFSEPDVSIYDAMNKALQKATGEAVLFLNADDYFLENHSLESLAIPLWDSKFDYICGYALVGDKWGNEHYWKPRTLTSFDFYCGNPSNHQAYLIKTNIAKKIDGFSLEYKYASDVKFMFEVIRRGYKGTILHLPIVFYSLEGASSTNHQAGIQELEKIISEYTGISDLKFINEFRKFLGDFDFRYSTAAKRLYLEYLTAEHREQFTLFLLEKSEEKEQWIQYWRNKNEEKEQWIQYWRNKKIIRAIKLCIRYINKIKKFF
jgi:glycosyltransferase involved in cell wall biosynthesis